jgi:hypothetical protein
MRSAIYPFSQSIKDYPNGGYIIKETFDDQSSIIEYDTEQILIEFPEINKDQLEKLLYVVTKNIVQMSF